jgi:LytS/YehU family sensor histidine kinase
MTPSAAPSTGTGLNNITRRLELLFPKKHKLTIDAGQSEYIVNLELQL